MQPHAYGSERRGHAITGRRQARGASGYPRSRATSWSMPSAMPSSSSASRMRFRAVTKYMPSSSTDRRGDFLRVLGRLGQLAMKGRGGFEAGDREFEHELGEVPSAPLTPALQMLDLLAGSPRCSGSRPGSEASSSPGAAQYRLMSNTAVASRTQRGSLATFRMSRRPDTVVAGQLGGKAFRSSPSFRRSPACCFRALPRFARHPGASARGEHDHRAARPSREQEVSLFIPRDDRKHRLQRPERSHRCAQVEGTQEWRLNVPA